MSKGLKFTPPPWVHDFVTMLKESKDFQTTERYGESWQNFHIRPLVEAAMSGDANQVFFALGILEGTMAKMEMEIKALKDELEEE